LVGSRDEPVFADGGGPEVRCAVTRTAGGRGVRRRARPLEYRPAVHDYDVVGARPATLPGDARRRGVPGPMAGGSGHRRAVLMLTACRHGSMTRVMGPVPSGADDYLTKPFAFR